MVERGAFAPPPSFELRCVPIVSAAADCRLTSPLGLTTGLPVVEPSLSFAPVAFVLLLMLLPAAPMLLPSLLVAMDALTKGRESASSESSSEEPKKCPFDGSKSRSFSYTDHANSAEWTTARSGPWNSALSPPNGRCSTHPGGRCGLLGAADRWVVKFACREEPARPVVFPTWRSVFVAAARAAAGVAARVLTGANTEVADEAEAVIDEAEAVLDGAEAAISAGGVACKGMAVGEAADVV
mmetsp:Transcript_8423/g.14184  ORF Transcript_8423/g.14184 Transcript_8423/m.14184 type:complete len:240 (+) Transcript_8423:67-786(+)